MKKIIELNKKDIEQIIAKHFEVSVDNVNVSVKQESEGYGMGEHTVCVAEAKVEKKYEN